MTRMIFIAIGFGFVAAVSLVSPARAADFCWVFQDAAKHPDTECNANNVELTYGESAVLTFTKFHVQHVTSTNPRACSATPLGGSGAANSMAVILKAVGAGTALVVVQTSDQKVAVITINVKGGPCCCVKPRPRLLFWRR